MDQCEKKKDEANTTKELGEKSGSSSKGYDLFQNDSKRYEDQEDEKSWETNGSIMGGQNWRKGKKISEIDKPQKMTL